MGNIAKTNKSEFIHICIIYRAISLLLSTLIFLLITFRVSDSNKVFIIIGTATACLIGSYLYKKNVSNETDRLFVIVISLEVFAYGIFIFLSGGFTSPYLWYFISSMVILAYIRNCRIINIFAIVWCSVCALLSRIYEYSQINPVYYEVNIAFGILVVSGSFYILCIYVHRLDATSSDLEESNRALQLKTQQSEQMLEHMINMSEKHIAYEEKKRIADEIHDIVMQKLFFVACSIRVIEEKLKPFALEDISKQLQDLNAVIESTIRELREVIYDVHWGNENQDNFVERISLYVNEISGMSGTQIEFNVDDGFNALPHNLKTAFYRIICEAVNNSVRHGKATRVLIKMTLSADCVAVEINDNGKGFEMSRITGTGRGLKNIRDIAVRLKGQSLIESNPECGTIVKVVLPG